MILNKKGDVTSGITFIVIIFFLAISFIVVAFINDKMKDVVEDTVLNQTSVASGIVDSMNFITTTGIQRGFALIFVFMIIGMMVSSFLVRVHPIWIFLYIIFACFAVVITVPIANVYQLFIENETLSSIASQQTLITWVMQHSVLILIATLALSMIILFAKLPDRGQV